MLHIILFLLLLFYFVKRVEVGVREFEKPGVWVGQFTSQLCSPDSELIKNKLTEKSEFIKTVS